MAREDGSIVFKVDAEDSGLKKDLKDVEKSAEKAGDGLEDLGKKTKKTRKEFTETDIAVGNLVADGIKALISSVGDTVASLGALADETREYRDDMAKLETAFTTAGHTTDMAGKAYEDFYAILGESDRSVEAVNHLAELTKNEQEVAKWATIAAGVTAKFGDSLPIEGLTEAA